MARECVVDTMILQKANAPLAHHPREGRLFMRRIALLNLISAGSIRVLISTKLLEEYRRQILSPRNEYISTFFRLLDNPDRVLWNWATPWSGKQRTAARSCRYPREDDHLLRTALRDGRSEILTEEGRLLAVDACVYRKLQVHIHFLP